MMGARFKVSAVPAQRGSSDYTVDIQKDRRGDFFELRVPEQMRESLDFDVLQTDSRGRHLLLFVRLKEKPAARFLCGHDEREWFVAAVPGAASTVEQAKQALKPRIVRARENELEIPTRLRNRRKNAAFRRQGEWFFVSAQSSGRDRINEKAVLHNEPLRRGTGKPHIVEFLYRMAGELVYVCPQHPNGVSEVYYRWLLQQNRKAAQWGWQAQRKNPRVYARGRIRHPDHATITLPDWHRVVLNTETETDAMRNMAFIKSASRFNFTSCSSRAERPADNRKTQEHYLPGRPPRVAEAD